MPIPSKLPFSEIKFEECVDTIWEIFARYIVYQLRCLSLCIDVPIDGDNPDHITWIYEKAQERADEFGIQGVSYRLTQGRNLFTV